MLAHVERGDAETLCTIAVNHGVDAGPQQNQLGFAGQQYNGTVWTFERDCISLSVKYQPMSFVPMLNTFSYFWPMPCIIAESWEAS